MQVEKEKTDKELGQKIHDYLVMCKCETPYNKGLYQSTSKEEKIEKIKKHYDSILQDILALDLTNDSMEDTSVRISKMIVNEICMGLDYDNFPKIMVFNNDFKCDQMVVVKGLKSISLCAHHWQTILGEVSIAYIPDEKLIGLSKFSRIVDFFSRRPQEQERLTLQIFHTLEYLLGVTHIAVWINSKHNCMSVRGVLEPASSTITSKLSGVLSLIHI